MVKKLIKYDFQSFLRLLLPIQLILIGIAAVNRFVQFFEDTSSTVYNTVFISSLVLYFISMAVLLVLTVVVAIIRFYQGMYTNEGYLNHTLPVTSAQHIWAKFLTSVIFSLGALLAMFLSFMVITAGELNIEIFKAFFYLVRRYFTYLGSEGALYLLEAIVFVCSALCWLYFKLDFCISVGQLAKKKKVLLAFGVFFGMYVIKQILGTIIIIFVNVNTMLMDRIYDWIAVHPHPFCHILFCSGIVICGVLALVYFLVTRRIMSKKLNLT